MSCNCKNKSLLDKTFGAVPEEESIFGKIRRYTLRLILSIIVFGLFLVITPIIIAYAVITVFFRGKAVVTFPDKIIKKLLKAQNGEKIQD